MVFLFDRLTGNRRWTDRSIAAAEKPEVFVVRELGIGTDDVANAHQAEMTNCVDRSLSGWWPECVASRLTQSQRQHTGHRMVELAIGEQRPLSPKAMQFGFQKVVPGASAVVVDARVAYIEHPVLGIGQVGKRLEAFLSCLECFQPIGR